MNGWIKLHRQLADNPIWLVRPFSEGQAWVDLLLITTYNVGFIKIRNGEIIKLKKGECGYSQLTLSERWGWSRGKVKRYLNLLETEKMIQQKNIGKYTIINILNYDKFQSDTTNDTINDTTNDTIDGHYQESKESKKSKENKKIDIYVSPEIEQIKQIYMDNCKNLIPINAYSMNKDLRTLIAEYLIDTDYNFEYFKEVCIKANKLVKIGDFRIDLKSVIKNHSGIYAEKYILKEQEKENEYNPCL